MLELSAGFLSIGLGMILGMVFGSFLLSMVSLWLGSKIVGSLNDEFYSAVKLVIYALLVNVVVAFVGGVLQFAALEWQFLDMVANIGNFILGLVSFFVVFMMTKSIYDISYLKTLVLIFVTGLIHLVLTAVLFFALGATFLSGVKIPFEAMPTEGDVEISESLNNEEVLNEDSVADSESDPVEVEKKSGPKIPKIPTDQ